MEKPKKKKLAPGKYSYRGFVIKKVTEDGRGLHDVMKITSSTTWQIEGRGGDFHSLKWAMEEIDLDLDGLTFQN